MRRGATFTIDQQVAWIERELSVRRAGYPVLVAGGKMEASHAEADLAMLTSVLAMMRVVQARGGRFPKVKTDPRRGKPVVVYFADEAARQSFMDIWAAAAPAGVNMEVPKR